MVEIPQGDFRQLCYDALFWYKGEVIKVLDHDHNITICFLRTKKTSAIPYKEHINFRPMIERIGMVNKDKSCMFVERNTIRQYLLGTSHSNTTIKKLPVPYPVGDYMRTKDAIYKFNCIEIISAIMNDYPPLVEAHKKAVGWGGACAFDKQFAVSSTGDIIYKTTIVGTYSNGVIVYKSGFEHLGILLENCYEKTSRTFKATPIRR